MCKTPFPGFKDNKVYTYAYKNKSKNTVLFSKSDRNKIRRSLRDDYVDIEFIKI